MKKRPFCCIQTHGKKEEAIEMEWKKRKQEGYQTAVLFGGEEGKGIQKILQRKIDQEGIENEN